MKMNQAVSNAKLSRAIRVYIYIICNNIFRIHTADNRWHTRLCLCAHLSACIGVCVVSLPIHIRFICEPTWTYAERVASS